MGDVIFLARLMMHLVPADVVLKAEDVSMNYNFLPDTCFFKSSLSAR